MVNIGKQFGNIMENKDYIEYIKKAIGLAFKDIQLNDIKDQNQPNNNFSISYKFKDDIIRFVKDRGYIESEIYSNGIYYSLFKLDNHLKNLELTFYNIDKIIDFLKRYYNSNS